MINQWHMGYLFSIWNSLSKCGNKIKLESLYFTHKAAPSRLKHEFFKNLKKYWTYIWDFKLGKDFLIEIKSAHSIKEIDLKFDSLDIINVM